MRKIWGGMVLAVVFLLISFLMEGGQSQTAYNPKNLVRLHVIANSDNEEDQRIKEEVRDLLLGELEPALSRMESPKELQEYLDGEGERVRLSVNDFLKSSGSQDQVRLEYGKFFFPVKVYGPLLLPGGEYEALKVIIGEGKGSNWWCVLFPPLCFIDITKSIPDGDSVEELLKKSGIKEKNPQEIKIKFKLLEVFSKKSPA